MIIRFSSIGDIVLTTPVIRCLKEQLKVELHFVCKSKFKDVLKSNPYIDKLHTFENEITEITDQLKAEDFDHLVDLHRNLRSIRLRKQLRKPSTTFPKLNKEKFLLTNFKWDLLPDIHIVDRYFKAVKPLGVVKDNQGLNHFIPSEDQVNISDYGIPAEFAVFAIGAQFATKRMPNEQIASVIGEIDQRVVLLGGPSDEENANSISKNQPNCINLVGQLSINQSASVIAQSKVLITHDTGMMHIAAALKRPIVSIWGNTVPKFGMYPYRPNHPESYSIHEIQLKCRPCSKIGYQSCPKSHFKCMVDQDTSSIAAQAKLFFQAQKNPDISF